MQTMRTMAFLTAALSALVIQPLPAAEPGGVAEYTAEYDVRDGRRRVARAEFSVRQIADGRYVFSSEARARGLYRLLLPDPAVERSEFVIDEDVIVPLSFRYEDGSRNGEDNYSVDFDAAAGEARVSGPAGSGTFPFDEGLLDRGSLQVALMRDLGACRTPGPYTYIDEDGIRTYRYERLEDMPAETGIGTLETVRFSQQREGSSRQTNIWLAPDLAFLPVRIEQVRDGEIDTVFDLEDADGLAPLSCSGFR